MDTLRERLAAKLGATKAPNARGTHVVQVASRAPGEVHLSAAKAVAHRTGAPAVVPGPAAAHAASGHSAVKAHVDSGAGGAHAHGDSIHWAYSGEFGPQAWGSLKPEFAKCSTGTRQSPIDIRDGFAVELEPVQFHYRPSGFSVIDNGHTVQVDVGPGNGIEVMGRRYDLLQFHFHRPSEERINGRAFDMVAHLVHKDAEGRLAVVAVLLDRGSIQPLIQTVWNNLPLEKGEALPARTSIDLNELLPADRGYFTYMGSLTTPPCSEGVLWLVMRKPVTVSPEQIALFSRLYPMNARPIQSVAGRMIKQSN
jgi:carbonic anhydrase